MKAAKLYYKKFAVIAAVLGIIGAVLIAVFYSAVHLFIFLVNYIIIFGFTGSSFYVMSKRKLQKHKQFLLYFYGSLSVRFFGAIIVVIGGLKLLDSYQIFFSVSFIISYICNSVIEVIYLSKIIRTES